VTDTTDLEFYIQHGSEERYLEYKSSMVWTGNTTTKVKIAKAMMAMSNLRNGGHSSWHEGGEKRYLGSRWDD